MLVVDASIAVRASFDDRGFAELGVGLVAPPLLWSEARSTLRQLWWRGHMDGDHAAQARERLEAAPIEQSQPSGLGNEAWRLAVALGWAKTYDAEYLALASLLGCQVITIDARLRRGADRTGLVISPKELS